VRASNAVDDPVSELAPGIFSVLVGKTLGMFTLAIVESVSRGILTVAVGEALGMLILVSVGPVLLSMSSPQCAKTSKALS